MWFTGLPCAGKSTIAQLVTQWLTDSGQTVTLLDADVIRPILCPDLGFSREDRHLNSLRIAFVAQEIVRHGGVAIVASISPFEEDRQLVRRMFDSSSFVEVFVSTSLEECERRDVKGLYAKARAGLVPLFTGVSSPYEIPQHSEVVCDTAVQSADGCALVIVESVENLRRERAN